MLPSTESIPITFMPRRRRAANVKALPGRNKPQLLATWLGIAAALLLAGCASTMSAPMPGSATAPVAAQWQAPLPHGGRLVDLSQWWAQFDDPLMLRLIEAGQQVSPTVAQASARIADARAARVAQRAALMPSLDASISSSRERADLGAQPIGTVSSAGLQVGWELDLFGAGRAA
ncbi:MAG TPA: hypothetical protein VM532_16395, partial [Burkholderiales bacterium]|nr:hypothetical protein [Burkholderiales bacterium]